MYYTEEEEEEERAGGFVSPHEIKSVSSVSTTQLRNESGKTFRALQLLCKTVKDFGGVICCDQGVLSIVKGVS